MDIPANGREVRTKIAFNELEILQEQGSMSRIASACRAHYLECGIAWADSTYNTVIDSRVP